MMIETVSCCTMRSPLGLIRLSSEGAALVSVSYCGGEPEDVDAARPVGGVLREAVRQLEAYFAGTLRAFDVPLGASGTEFQRLVWGELCRIPFGRTISYAELARRIGRPAAVRAVGAANGRNPLAIVVPCHRVIGADGTLTGYAGGLDLKERLLAHEAEALRVLEAGSRRAADRVSA